jgi:hypothetical protein
MKKFNKKAKSDGKTTLIVIAVLAMLAVLMYAVFFRATPASTVPTIPGTNIPSSSTCAIQAVATAPTATDALNPGTSIGGLVTYYAKNGVYVGTTAPTVSKGDKVKFLTGNATTVDQIGDEYTIDCGANAKEVKLKSFSNASISVFSNIGTGVLTNAAAGGDVNESISTSVLNWKVTMTGNDKKSTGKMLAIIELSIPANVSSVTMDGKSSIAVPNGHTRVLTNGYAAAFELDAIDGATPVNHNIQVVSSNGRAIAGVVYLTFYNEQDFVQPDGSFATGAFDTLNAAKWQDRTHYNFLIK